MLVILLDSEERTSSTHALTMFRYNYTINKKTYKVGKWQSSTIQLVFLTTALCWDSLQTFGTQLDRNRSMNFIQRTTSALTFASWSSTWQERWLTRTCGTGTRRWETNAPTSPAFASPTRLICKRQPLIAATSSLRKSNARLSSCLQQMARMWWPSFSRLWRQACTTSRILTRMTSWTTFSICSTILSHLSA